MGRETAPLTLTREDDLNIGFISGHACMRCQKMAIPLVERGHKVHMVAAKIPTFMERYDTFYMCAGINHYIEAIEHLSNVVDVFHVHNEPSWFVTAIKERHPEIPVILDVHDSYLARMTPDEEKNFRKEGALVSRVRIEERNNFQLADGLVFVGKTFGENICKEFKLDQPSITLPSYLPRQLYNYRGAGWLGDLVYEGRVDLPSATKDTNYGFRYCDYLQVAADCAALDMNFHIYGPQTAGEEFQEEYKDIAVLHEGRPFSSLLKAIGRHDWGLVGNVFPTPEWDVAMPNKLFDYLAASVPVCVINAKECAELVEAYGVGIVVGSIQELAERWGEHRECRKNVIKFRQEFAMENHIDKLEGLYDVVSK